MPASTRSCRRAGGDKRNMLGVLSDSNSEPYEFASQSGSAMPSCLSEGENFKIPSNFDFTNKEYVSLLLEDLEKEVKQMQSNLSLLEIQANKELHEVYFLNTLKMERNVRNMTVRDYNTKFLYGQSLIEVVKRLCQEENTVVSVQTGSQSASTSMSIKYGFRTKPAHEGRMELETPSRNNPNGKGMETPTTIARTARKGEAIL
jgi:hypothetical protein